MNYLSHLWGCDYSWQNALVKLFATQLSTACSRAERAMKIASPKTVVPFLPAAIFAKEKDIMPTVLGVFPPPISFVLST